jgi:hypothetical protein
LLRTWIRRDIVHRVKSTIGGSIGQLTCRQNEP